MFDIIIREAASRFGLGDKAATLVQTVVAYAINKDTGGLTGLIQRFRDAGLGDLAQSWVSGGTQAKAMSNEQADVMFGQKGGLLDMVTSKLGLDRGVALPALSYILPSIIGKLTPNGSIPTNLPAEVHNFIGNGLASNVANKAQETHSAASTGGSGLWKWLALLGAGILAVLLLMKCGNAEKPELPTAPVEQIENAVERTGEAAGDVVEGTADAVKGAAGAVGEAAGDVVEGTGDVVKGAAGAVGDAAGNVVDGATNMVKGAADAVEGLFVDTSNDVVKLITGDEKIVLADRAGVPVMKVFFDTAKYDVSPKFASVATDVADHIKENSGSTVILQGFNDPRGDAAMNAELSKNRAEAVRDALVAMGVPADRIDLRKPNSTVPEGGSYDEMRRVEVTVAK